MIKTILFSAFLAIGMSSAFAQSKIAHLNSQEIMQAMPSYKAAVTKLQTYEEDGYQELQAMKADYDATLAEINAKMQAGPVSDVIMQSYEQKLAKKERNLEERQQSLQTELQAYSQELNKPILEKVEKAVKTVSDRHGYDYVFDVSTLMIHNGPDITKEVIAEMLKLE